MNPVRRLLEKLDSVSRSLKGWKARCPAHLDQDPSLSITEGAEGRALVHCHAGCEVEDVCGAVGLSVADLFPVDSADVDTTSLSPRNPGVVSAPPDRPVYDSEVAAIDVLRQVHGEPSARWDYHDAEGELVGVILRWDTPDGKQIRPMARCDGGWTLAGMPAPRPLYRLPELADAEQVFICEGEKAADAACSIGLVATTSAHGSQSAKRTDWSPLAGKDCVILPDLDEPGNKYAKTVAGILTSLSPPATVKIVDLGNLPDGGDLPEGGDLHDWLEAHDAVESETLREELQKVVQNAREVQSMSATNIIQQPDQYQTFPVDVLPSPVREFVEAAARAIGCDPAFVALPLLTTAGAAIGNACRIELKSSWREPPILWTAIVGESGCKKSPALELALKPARDRERRAMAEHEDRQSEYRRELMHYERDLQAWRKGDASDPPDPPADPVAERYICEEATVEALIPLLRDQPRGLLTARDELAGWLGGFDRYKTGKGGDVAIWLEMYGGRPITVDRKTGNSPTLYVPQAAVCVTGGIQPDTLRRCLGQEYYENGLAARLLLACPPPRICLWTEDTIDADLESARAAVFDGLYRLCPSADEGGAFQPVVIGLTLEAKQEWVRFYNEHAVEQAGLTGDLSSAWSKLEGYAARLALVIHCIRHVAGDPELEPPDAVEVVDEISMAAGIRLSRWFGREARRVYAMMRGSEQDHNRRQLVELIGKKGGSITARKLTRSSRNYSKTDEAEAALKDLVDIGWGYWEPIPTSDQGGRPTVEFRLHRSGSADTTPTNPGEIEGSVNVDTVEPPDDGWEEL